MRLELVHCPADNVGGPFGREVKNRRVIEVMGIDEILCEKPSLDWGQSDGPVQADRCGDRYSDWCGGRRELGDRLMFEDLPRREVEAGAAGARHDLQTQNGFAADL